jgi:2-dehydrotetronate isomerase
MPHFAANLSLMFTEVPFLDRFDAAAQAGFTAVEFLFPYQHPAKEVGERLQRNGLTQALFNLPPGDWDAGEKGFAALPDRFADLEASLRTALPYAQATGVKRLHLMAGLAKRSDPRAVAAFRKSVIAAAAFFAPHGLDVVIEPINPRNVPGYFLDDFAFARDLIIELKMPNLKLQFDIYHCQIIHGDVTMRLREMMPIIGHVQIASVPSRHEPDGEELNYPFLFGELDRLGYDGFVGCEYNPRGKTTDGLGWFRPYAGAKR